MQLLIHAETKASNVSEMHGPLTPTKIDFGLLYKYMYVPVVMW